MLAILLELKAYIKKKVKACANQNKTFYEFIPMMV